MPLHQNCSFSLLVQIAKLHNVRFLTYASLDFLEFLVEQQMLLYPRSSLNLKSSILRHRSTTVSDWSILVREQLSYLSNNQSKTLTSLRHQGMMFGPTFTCLEWSNCFSLKLHVACHKCNVEESKPQREIGDLPVQEGSLVKSMRPR